MAMISHSSVDENQLIKDNMGLVIDVVKTFNPANEDIFDEYTQAGRIGLLKAARTNIPHLQWSTIAWNNVKWSIHNYIKQESNNQEFLPITVDPSGEPPDSIEDYLPDSLLERERNVILLRNQGHSFQDIGEIYGFSKSWANYVFHSGIQKIQEANNLD